MGTHFAIPNYRTSVIILGSMQLGEYIIKQEHCQNYKFICTSFRNRWKRELLANFSGLFHMRVQINFISPTMYLNWVYHATLKIAKQLINCAEKSRNMCSSNHIQRCPLSHPCYLNESGTRRLFFVY